MTKIGTFLSRNRRFIPLSATIVLFFVAYAAGAVFYPGMRDPQVFLNLFRTSPFYLISGIGMTFVILSGGIDLSVSGVVALTTVASAALLRSKGWNPWIVMLLMLGMGSALGAIMGAFITYMKVQPFIATLAGQWFARGMCFFISDDAIPITDRVYRILGQTKILIPGLSDPVAQTGPFITILVLLEAVVLAAAIYIAHYTRFGRTVYSIGGNGGRNEISARLMGLPVKRTKMLVYTLNGFCSALAGITMSIYVMSGHGLYAQDFEMSVIASVVIGGTMLTGGVGYVFGTLFGVLIRSVIQTLIQFNGQLSSWWTTIVVGALTLVFIGVQSILAARKTRQLASSRLEGRKRQVGVPGLPALDARSGLFVVGRSRRLRNGQLLLFGGGAVFLVALALFAMSWIQKPGASLAADKSTPHSEACQLKPFRQDEAASLIQAGAVITYERNGGAGCIDELFAVYPDGRIVGDNGGQKIDMQVSSAEVEQLLAGISSRGWFTEEMYNTWHTPCGQCFGYYLTVVFQGEEKTVKAVDGGTDAPADYWQVVSLINGCIPQFDYSD
jgi:ribose/xylose/arabinose/galactoside ABC-type transport system permease subunit